MAQAGLAGRRRLCSRLPLLIDAVSILLRSRLQQRQAAGHCHVAVQRGSVACAYHPNSLPWLIAVGQVGTDLCWPLLP
jgi:hypothetical protein